MNKLNYQSLRARFNRYASTYDAHAVLYQAMAESLLQRLSLIKLEPAVVLDLGCGTGELTALLQQHFPKAIVLSLDVAEQALQRSVQHPIQAWAESLPLKTASVDLVVSNALLPWCNDLLPVFEEVNRVLKPDGLFLFTSLGPDSLKAVRQAWASVDEQGHVHRFLDMHDVGDRLLAAGMNDPVMDTESIQINYSSVAACLDDLRFTGSGNLLAERQSQLTGKARFEQFKQALQQQFSPEGKLALQAEVIHGHAWHGEHPVGVSGEVTVDLSQLRALLR